MSSTPNLSNPLLDKKLNRRELVIGAGKTAVTTAVATSALAGMNTAALAQGESNPIDADTSARRHFMEGMVDKYLASVVAHDPKLCPLTDNAVFVENQQVLPIGEAGWRTINRIGSYRHYFCDFEMNQVGYIGNVYEHDAGCVYVLRLKFEGDKISEIDQWISRDPMGAENYEKLGAPDPIWLEPIPLAQRQSREALAMNAHIYFQALERNDGTGIYPFRDDCERIEHARKTVSQTVNTGYGHADVATKFVTMPAKAQYEYGMMAFVTKIRDRFAPVIDVERGAVMGQGTYDFDGALTKIHFIKDNIDWTIPAYFRTARSHMATEAFKVINGSFRYIEMTFIEVPYGTRQHWLGKPMTVELTYEPTRPKPRPVKADTHAELVALNHQVLDAIINDCPCELPLAEDARYTENGVTVKPGSGGLWKTIKGYRKFSIHLADPETRQAGWFGTLNENGLFAAVAMRLKVRDGYIHEIETLIARPEPVGRRGELIAATNTMFQAPYLADLRADAFEAVPAVLRNAVKGSRSDITRALENYQRALVQRDASLASLTAGCLRRENGVNACNNPAGPQFSEERTDLRFFAGDLAAEINRGYLTQLTRLRERRTWLVDEQQGLALDLTVFDNAAAATTINLAGAGSVAVPRSFQTPWTDLHAQLYKVENGRIAHLEDLVRRVPYGQKTGWAA
jgi:hypothetical protein